VQLLVSDEPVIYKTLNKNLVHFIKNYCNKHTLDTFQGRTPCPELSQFYDDDCLDGVLNKTFDRKDDIRKTFQSLKSAPLTQTMEGFGDREESQFKMPMIFALPENQSEVVYSDLLQRLMVLVHRIKEVGGMWREHVQLVQNLVEVIDLFYMPEVHVYLVPLLFDFLVNGNKTLREVSCECLAKIAKY